MKHRFLVLALCLALLCTLVPAAAAEDVPSDPIETPCADCGQIGVHLDTCPQHTVDPLTLDNPDDGEKSDASGNQNVVDPSKVDGTDPSKTDGTDLPKTDGTDLPKTDDPQPELECNCGTLDDNHAESCPLYKSIFDRLMACETFDSFCDLLESLTPEQCATLDETMFPELEARLRELEPEPEPAVVIEEPADIPMTLQLDDTDYEEPRIPAVDYTNVAPIFGN